MRMRITVVSVLTAAILAAGCGTDPADNGKNTKTTTGAETSADADSKTNSDAEGKTDSATDSKTNSDAYGKADSDGEERTEVRREKYDDCDGSGHGYVEIYYSDGSMETEEY